jgi:hypothetical protein
MTISMETAVQAANNCIPYTSVKGFLFIYEEIKPLKSSKLLIIWEEGHQIQSFLIRMNKQGISHNAGRLLFYLLQNNQIPFNGK